MKSMICITCMKIRINTQNTHKIRTKQICLSLLCVPYQNRITFITSVISRVFLLIQPRRIDGSRRLQPLDGSRLDVISPEARTKLPTFRICSKNEMTAAAADLPRKPLKINGKRTPRRDKQYPAQIPYARDKPVRRSRPTYPGYITFVARSHIVGVLLGYLPHNSFSPHLSRIPLSKPQK